MAMIRLLSFCSFLCFAFSTAAQNLVPNASFEEYDNGCPANLNEMPIGWKWWRESPNCFHTCVEPLTLSDSVGWAPMNGFGYQEPFDGESYVGMCCFSGGDGGQPSFRECMGTGLISPLVTGEEYHVTFMINLAVHGFYWDFSWACNRFGVYFTNQGYDWEVNPVEIPNFSQVYSNEVIMDTSEWVTVSGSFVADQPYTHMGLGVFFDDALIDAIQLFASGNPLVYYYVDALYVSTEPNPLLVGEKTSVDPYFLFPNPAQESVRLNLQGRENAIRIFDSNGRCVLQNLYMENNPEIYLTGFSPGVYVVESRNEKSVLRKKLVISP